MPHPLLHSPIEPEDEWNHLLSGTALATVLVVGSLSYWLQLRNVISAGDWKVSRAVAQASRIGIRAVIQASPKGIPLVVQASRLCKIT